MSETIKNKGGRPRVNATPITVRVPPNLLAILDSLAAETASTRPEALRFAFAEWAEAYGLLTTSRRIRDRPLMISVPKDVEEKLRDIAGRKPISDVVELALQEWLDKFEKGDY
ncbi:hypothetical protein Brsp07_03015 [Brucella sp. NBRC 14130]|uniref:ribbon-helix-helix domain-containing protein n=1 Tax=Brucella sp. NBRC 14130 TaxID=3075483 RepID=UPI0030A93473